MDFCLHDLLFQFCLYRCPALLQDDEVFDHLHRFIHALLVRAARSEQERMMARIRKVSSC